MGEAVAFAATRVVFANILRGHEYGDVATANRSQAVRGADRRQAHGVVDRCLPCTAGAT